ncbi:class I SAM-dependent methyltransferase [Algoriphagus pacificus]|uniref:Class I SAM-dependent methyltransferase n=1 Tax=Algoriphagus pacificus TaxID=2811234 RepID=A0ABS3CIP9_9BACT|nr:class I SAM-dependent methyltransferase [Algoriphagus pacificus]MBN7816630.1 class I SAM-dependent methyltransferase [Algoriphagus pacificus]
MNFSTITDADFDSFYPVKLQRLSATHWTPVAVAKKALSFLNEDGKNTILDLGSGAGKFCLLAASWSNAEITGIEQRAQLVQQARKIASQLQLQNLQFLQGDLIHLDFKDFDSFYFFNSFEELINPKDKMDKEEELDIEAHQNRIEEIRKKFEQLKKGTRIATYCGECHEIPESYLLIKSENKGKLKFWEKRG